MATMVGQHGDLNTVLRQLVALDYDAVEAYRAAIERLNDVEAKAALSGFMKDHERHIEEVGALIRIMGGDPPKGPDAKRILTQGKVVIAGLFGDRPILMAMKTNEDDTNTAYERTSSRADLTPEAQLLLRGNLEDERRHRAWIEQRLASERASAHP
jgi:rubrerythrin